MADKVYLVAKYLRISKEDEKEEKSFDKSESIDNQSMIIDQYLVNHPDMRVYDTYIDDGYSGLFYDRKDYQRMMADIDAGLVNTIICKSISRLGRDLSTTINLLQREFVLKNIRFIAVTDNIDTGGKVDNGLDIPIRAMFNDYYCRNLSANVKDAFKAKVENGLFIGAFASYGYVKNPEDHNHLVIDAEAAEIVKRVFQMYLMGYGTQTIVKTLNRERIPCPAVYKQQKGLNYRNSKKLMQTTYWTYATIYRMLRNEIYCGHTVQHKEEKIAYNIKKTRQVEKEEWVIKRDTHEAIIDQETFERTQQLLKEKKVEPKFGETSIYAGIFFCGDCGRAMGKNHYNGKVCSFRCNTYARAGKEFCTNHIVRKERIDLQVITAIRKTALAALSECDIGKIEKIAIAQKYADKTSQVNALELRKKELGIERQRMLQNLSKKVIGEDDFVLYNVSYKDEMEQLQERIDALLVQQTQKGELERQYKLWVEQFLKYKDITSLSREVVVNLIERMDYYSDGTLKIKFLFKNPYSTE